MIIVRHMYRVFPEKVEAMRWNGSCARAPPTEDGRAGSRSFHVHCNTKMPGLAFSCVLDDGTEHIGLDIPVSSLASSTVDGVYCGAWVALVSFSFQAPIDTHGRTPGSTVQITIDSNEDVDHLLRNVVLTLTMASASAAARVHKLCSTSPAAPVGQALHRFLSLVT